MGLNWELPIRGCARLHGALQSPAHFDHGSHQSSRDLEESLINTARVRNLPRCDENVKARLATWALDEDNTLSAVGSAVVRRSQLSGQFESDELARAENDYTVGCLLAG